MRISRLAGDQPDVHAYDPIDSPEIQPVVTRVNIHSGPCRTAVIALPEPRLPALPGSPFAQSSPR